MNAPIIVTLWRSFSRGRSERHDWASFVDTFVAQPEVVQDKRRVAGFSLGRFAENRRLLRNVEEVFALTLDFDEGDTTLKQASKLFPGTFGVAYTTFSHSPEKPKLRVVYLLSRSVTAEEYARLWDWAEHELTPRKHALDESARDASRFWYLPSHPPEAPYEWARLEGKPLNVGEALKTAHSRPLPSPETRPKKAPGRLYKPGRGRECADAADETFFGRALAAAGLAHRTLENGALSVTCPWAAEHSSGFEDDTSTVVLPSTSASEWGLFHCSHSHCAKRVSKDLLDVLPFDAIKKAHKEHGAGLLRTKIRAGFVQRLEPKAELAALERFVLRCYPPEGAPLIWTVKIESRAHVEGLQALPLRALRGQRVDLVLRGREITWGKLVPNEWTITR